MIISQMEIPALNVHVVVALVSTQSASKNSLSTLFAPSFDPTKFVNKEDFDRLKAKNDAFMEQTSKNHAFIHNILGLIIARLTNHRL